MKKAELISYLRKICKLYGVKTKFTSKKTPGSLGFYDRHNNEIEVYTGIVNTRLASVAMHELAHALNVRDKKYPIFHLNDYPRIKSKFLKSKFMATAHRAEMFTDRRGKILFQHYFKSPHYVEAYDSSAKSKDSLKKIILSWE